MHSLALVEREEQYIKFLAHDEVHSGVIAQHRCGWSAAMSLRSLLQEGRTCHMVMSMLAMHELLV